MTSKQPAERSKGQPATGLSRLEEYRFGTDADMENRRRNGYGVEHAPDPGSNPPAFVQIKPEVTAKNVNRPKPGHVSGDMKFSGFKG